MENIKIYETIRLFRGKRRVDELVKLSEEKRDFEFRRLFIEEIEQDLHVIFSWQTICGWISWVFVFFSLIFFQSPLIFYSLIGISFISKTFSFFQKKKYLRVFKGYKFSLACVDSLIKKDYGITLS